MVCQCLLKLTIELSNTSLILVTRECPEESNAYVHKQTYTTLPITALFIVVKTWKQPRCASIGEWIHKLWHSHTMKNDHKKENKL